MICSHRYRGRFAEDLAEKAPDVYATLRAQEELVVGVLEAQARAKDEKGRAPQKQKKLREALGALRTPSLVVERGVPCPLDPDVMISGLHAPSSSPTMFKSALTQSLVGNFKRDWPPPAVVPLLLGIIHGAVAESVRWKVRVMVEGHAALFLAICVMVVRIEWLAGGALPMDFWSTFFYKFGARCVVIVFGLAAGLLISEQLALHRANRA